jgi:heme-degrading monooxygenase HmoA
MHARVSTYRFEASRADDVATAFESALGDIEALEGERGAFVLVDRQKGKAMTITLWEDESSLEASAEAANRLRSDATTSYGGSIESVESFEVPLHKVS